MSADDDRKVAEELAATPPTETPEQLCQIWNDYETGKNNTELLPKQILYNPLLLPILQHQLDKKIVDEMLARHAILINTFGMWVKNHATSSYNLLINSKSGTGKDYITQKILDTFPQERITRRTRISATAFTYWHNGKFEPEWTWDGKVCYLQDVSNNILNCDVFKVMVSDGSHATIVIEHRAVDLIIKGKPVVFITAADAQLKDEMLRRFPIITLTETEDQTKKILKKWAKFATTGTGEGNLQYLTQALQRLKEVYVIIPFADEIANFFAGNNVIARTNFIRFLDMIKASAALHQFQRKVDEMNPLLPIIAEPIDYEYARIAFEATQTNPYQIPLTRKQQQLIQAVEEMGEGWFKASEIKQKTPFLRSKATLYTYLDDLSEYFFDVEETQDEGSDGRPIGRTYNQYKLKKLNKLNLPNLQEMLNKLNQLNNPQKGIPVLVSAGDSLGITNGIKQPFSTDFENENKPEGGDSLGILTKNMHKRELNKLNQLNNLNLQEYLYKLNTHTHLKKLNQLNNHESNTTITEQQSLPDSTLNCTRCHKELRMAGLDVCLKCWRSLPEGDRGAEK